MEQQNLTLLILAAEYSDFVWIPIKSSEELLMDYAIKYAVETGCKRVVVTVCEDKQDIALKHMKEIEQKYSVLTAVVTVNSRYNGSANQLLAARKKEYHDDLVLVVHADSFYGKDMIIKAAKSIVENGDSCMCGTIPI